jgi:hypothetical protein
MHWKHVTLLLLLIVAFMFACPGYAQDLNNPDTIRTAIVNVDAGDHFGVRVTMFNDEPVHALSLGFWWNDPDLTLDSVSFFHSKATHIATKPITIDNVNHNVLIGVVKIFESPIANGDSLLATMWFTAAPAAPDQFIEIDSGFIPPAGVWKFNIGPGFESFGPKYVEGKVIIGDPQPPPVFVLSDNVFDFEAFEGGSNPPSQTLDIVNGGGQHLVWTATKLATWLNFTPVTDTAPSNVVISVDISALSDGTYKDTIIFTDPNATNSPQKVAVNLDVIVPPPTIQLVPTSFEFVAQQDSANPQSQQLTINDIGAGTLQWAASNSKPWLTLSDYNGLANETIDLMVDITGMTYGTYWDTVVVSDPVASNNPQRAPVKLTIVSGFPIIGLSPSSFFVAATDGIDPYDRPMYIANTGGDLMGYTITSRFGRVTFSPNSGSVGSGDTNTSTVSFHSGALGYGLNYDTIKVTSPTALNSPQRIPVVIWKMELPPLLQVTPGTLTFNVFECYNWPPLSQKIITVNNAGAEYLNWTATKKSTWLTLSPTSGPNDASIFAGVNIAGLAPGSYFDTVVVSAQLSINEPETVFVFLNVSEQTATPVVGAADTTYEFIFKENEVGTAEQSVEIRNLVGGCMSWYIDETTLWLDVEPDSGEVPDQCWVGVNGFGLPLGKTSSTFQIMSDEATNDPVTLHVDLYIWTWGDCNCDGIIDIDDIVYIIMYLFADGPDPCPRSWVADVDCSHHVDIDDVVYLINAIFASGPPPCDSKAEPLYEPATHTFQDAVK